MFEGKVSYAISSVTWLAIEFIQLALQRSVQKAAMKQEYAVINLHISVLSQVAVRGYRLLQSFQHCLASKFALLLFFADR